MPKLEPKKKINLEETLDNQNTEEVVSAYTEEGQKRIKENKKGETLSPGFKVFLFCIYALGLAAALGIVFLLQQCS